MRKLELELKNKYQKINNLQTEAAILELSQCGFSEIMLRKNPEFLIRLWNDFIVPNRKNEEKLAKQLKK
tara:strand:+ start:366 stop:572 length:207 start_codon:yes stop_codon:yes gene_type:complete